jgi:hypothetical protein
VRLEDVGFKMSCSCDISNIRHHYGLLLWKGTEMPYFPLILTCTNCRKSSAVQYGIQIPTLLKRLGWNGVAFVATQIIGG